MTSLSAGDEIAGYRLGHLIGRGGMGMVFEATHIALDRRVAVKLIAPELAASDEFRQRFQRESRLAASIDHAHVIPVFDAGEEQGQLYVAMRYVEGTDLSAVLATEGALEPSTAAEITSHVADALDAAHQQGLVHRDVKPANILLERRRTGYHAYLTDFGLTKAVSGASGGLTKTGQWLGTPDYAAPEQIQGQQIDGRADIYALGCVLFHALTGAVPFQRDTDVAKIFAHVSDPPPRLAEAKPDLPPALDGVLQRALAKEPGERHPTAGEMAAASRTAIGAPTPTPGSAVVTGSPTRSLPTEAAPTPAQPPPAAPTVPERGAETVPAGPPEAVEPPATERLRSETGEAPATRKLPPRPDRRVAVPAALGALAVAVVVGAVILLTGGGDEAPGNGEEVTRAGAPAITDRFETGSFPVGVSVAGDGVVLVADRVDHSVTVIRGPDDQTTEVLGDDNAQIESVIQASNGLIYAVDAGWTQVHVLDPETLEPAEDAIGTGPTPRAIAETDDGILWVADRDADSLLRIAPDRDVTRIEGVCSGPRRLAVGRGLLFVACRNDGTVRALDPGDGSEITSVTVGGEPLGITVARGAVWVVSAEEDLLHRVAIDAEDQTSIPVGERPRDVVFAFGSLWVPHGESNDVWRIDPESLERQGAPIEIGTSLEAIAAGEDALYVAGGEGGDVVEISPGG